MKQEPTDEPRARWPINESQRRVLTIALADLEQDVERVAEAMRRRMVDGRLTRHTEPVPADPSDARAELVRQIQEAIGRLADDLELLPREQSVTRSLAAALLLDEVGLVEAEPRRLRSHGEVDAATAEYLQCELPHLQALVRALTGTLRVAR